MISGQIWQKVMFITMFLPGAKQGIDDSGINSSKSHLPYPADPPADSTGTNRGLTVIVISSLVLFILIWWRGQYYLSTLCSISV